MYKKNTAIYRFIRVCVRRNNLLAMKLSWALLLISCVHVSAYTHAQHISIRANRMSLVDVFQEIKKQTGYHVFYDASVIRKSKPVTTQFNNAPLEEALDTMLHGQGLSYRIVDQNIVITRGTSPALSDDSAISTFLVQEIVITGSVRDLAGQPLPGTTIRVQGSTAATTTDDNGNYRINVPNRNRTLEFSLLGYETLVLGITNSDVLHATLRPFISDLDEVVVVGYGTQKKANLTGAVDQVGPEVFEDRPIPNISQGLVGAVPNLNIRMLDGKPTQSPSFNVRGTTSIGQQGSALVLIDGVEGDPRMLNPADIESVSILKDAASASIYGARAAFGVVLITTKAATEGKTAINYSTNFSFLSPTVVPDNVTESYPWAQHFSDAWARWNDNGNTPTAVNKTLPFSPTYLAEIKRRWEDPSLPRIEVDPSTGEYQYYYSTDWYAELMKKNLRGQEHNLVLSGGNEKASFYVSGRYHGQDGLFRHNSDDYGMYNTRAKGNIQLTRWLEVENNVEFSNMDYRQPINVGEGSGIWRNMADEGHPLAPLMNPDGSLSFPAAYTVGDLYLGRSGADNVQRFLKNRTAATAKFFESSLTIRGDFTFQNSNLSTHQRRVQVPYSRFEGITGYTGTNTNDIQERRQSTDYLATNLYANYDKTFQAQHDLNLLVGVNYEQSVYNNVTTRRNGIVYEDAGDLNLALGQGVVTNGGYQKWAIAGGFFRVNYAFKNRYLLEVNGRYDGSSKFPTNQQWAFFPSASLGWRITEEGFWNVNPQAISEFKLRASYGSLGNGNINPYAFTENFQISQSDRIINGVRPQRTGQPGVIPAGLTWETVTTANVGLDVSAFSNRLNFVGDLYRRWTTDMFTVGPTLPAIYGTTVPRGNYADLETTGWELSLRWRDQFMAGSKSFNYDVRFVLSDYRAQITKYNNVDKILTDYYAGQRVGEIWGYRVEGLFRSEEEIASSPSQINIQNTATRRNYVGDLKFVNLDGDDVIFHGTNRVGDSGDKTIIGNSEPRYTYGFNLNGDWNGIFFSAFFQGIMKQDWYPSAESRFWGQYNRPYNQYPRWHENNMYREEVGNFDAYLPRLVGYIAQGSNKVLTTPNDRFLQNVGYIRLRNLQIGYTLPQQVVSKVYANSVRVFLSGENLWTWSPLYKWTKDTDVTSIFGSDRDLSGGSSGDGYNFPMLKSVSFGVNINF